MNSLSLSIIEKRLPATSGLDENQLLELQSRIFALLSRRAKLFSGGDTSIANDTATELLDSIYFTLGEYVRVNSLGAASLLSGDAEDIYDRAIESLKSEHAASRRLYKAVIMTAPEFVSESYRDSVRCINGFIEGYDLYYMSHLMPKDVDYQLCLPVDINFKGIRYVNDYLSRLYIENRFLQRFNPSLATAVLRTAFLDYKSVPLNLFESIATNALGLSIIGENPLGLTVDNEKCEKITAVLKKHDGEKEATLVYASDRLCVRLGLSGQREKDYVCETALSLLPRINALLESSGRLNGVFTAVR